MALFDLPLRDHMSSVLHTVGPDARLPAVDRLMQDACISGVPVVDSQLRPLGVVSRTDLLHAGTVAAVTGTFATRLTVPDRRVADVMHGRALSVPVGGRLHDAVAAMRRTHVHRVLVVDDDGTLVGLVSGWDVMRVVASARVERPIGTLMSFPALTVSPVEDAQHASERLREAHVHGLIVVERGWPIGVFGQEEALAAERWPAATAVEQWFNPAVLTVSPSMAAHRAAAQAVAMRCRYLSAMDLQGIGGILTATDFLEVEAP